MINANGERFVDEGADFRNYTYAKYGRVILMQPSQFAWQVFDAKIIPMLRDEYRIKQVTKVRADTLEELCAKLEDVDAAKALATIKAYNEAVMTDVPFDPERQGRPRHRGPRDPEIELGQPDRPAAVRGLCRDLRTYLHLRRPQDRHQRAGHRSDGAPIPGLFAAGELVGGLFYFNYPGGTGLMAGAVFGKIAGRSAAQHACRSTE